VVENAGLIGASRDRWVQDGRCQSSRGWTTGVGLGINRHDLRFYLSADSGAYGWMNTLANLFHAAEDTPTPLRYIHSIHSRRRREISSTKRKIHYTSQAYTSEHVSTNEMDMHADTCCLGKHSVPLYYTGEVCNVHAYSDELDAIKDVQIGAGATHWTDPSSGSSYILEIQ
jgi:hypothetical protein